MRCDHFRMATAAIALVAYARGEDSLESLPPAAEPRQLREEDCTVGLLQWQQTWSPEKKSWCCAEYGLGCEVGQHGLSSGTGSQQGGGQASVNCWHTQDEQEQRWCCETRGISCPENPAPQKFPGANSPSSLPSPSSPSGARVQLPVDGQGNIVPVVYDCALGLSTWDSTWPTAKVGFCCRQWDQSQEWPPNRPSACCEQEHVGCPDEQPLQQQEQQLQEQQPQQHQFGESQQGTGNRYDCDSGLDHWHSEWSVAKMSWCCQTWDTQDSWPESRPSYCCDIEDLGCESRNPPPTQSADQDGKRQFPTFTTTPAPKSTSTSTNTLAFLSYSCEAEDTDKWQEDWSERRKSYCCWKWTSQSEHWKVANGGDHRQEYCCLIKGYGCPLGLVTTSTTITSSTKTTTTKTYTTSTTIPSSYDCSAGILSWRTSWTSLKREYCCLHAGLGCPAGVLPTQTHTSTTAAETSTTTTVPETTTTTPAETTVQIVAWSDAQKTRTSIAKPAEGTSTTVKAVEAGTTVWQPATLPPVLTLPATPTWMPVVAPWESVFTQTSTTWTETTSTLTTFTSTMTETETEMQPTLPAGEWFDCESGLSHWQQWWSADKKKWCCDTTGFGCSDPTKLGTQKTPQTQDVKMFGVPLGPGWLASETSSGGLRIPVLAVAVAVMIGALALGSLRWRCTLPSSDRDVEIQEFDDLDQVYDVDDVAQELIAQVGRLPSQPLLLQDRQR